MRDTELERRVLDFVYTTEEVLSVPALAFFAPCTLEEADRCLTSMAGAGRIQLESDDDGNVFYVLPGRFLATPATRAALAHRLDGPTPVAAAAPPGFVAPPMTPRAPMA